MRRRDIKFQIAFGQHLRSIRAQRGWTQTNLAAVSRVNETQISNIESGHASLNLHTLKALAAALGKHPADLLNFEFDYKLNTDFNVTRRKGNRPGTTRIIKKLVEDQFFSSGRSVGDVIAECQKTYKVNLASPETCGALLNLVKKNVLKRKVSTEGKYRYQN